jgi:hypothetical protein
MSLTEIVACIPAAFGALLFIGFLCAEFTRPDETEIYDEYRLWVTKGIHK